MKIEINADVLDGVVAEALKRHLRCIKNPKFPSKNPEDIEYERQLAAAMKIVIKHYTS